MLVLYVKEQKILSCVCRRLLSKSEYPFQLHINDLQLNGKKGKQASCQRDRERVCVCDLAVPENAVGVRCETAAWERVDFVVMRTCTLKLFV